MKHILHTLNYKRTPKHNNLYNFPNSIIYMDPVKEAFSKVKQDISDLKEELEAISSELIELKQILNPTHIPTHIPTQDSLQQTDRQTHNLKHKIPLSSLNYITTIFKASFRSP